MKQLTELSMIDINKQMKILLTEQQIRPIDVQFSKQLMNFIAENNSQETINIVGIVSLLISNEYSKGNICVPIDFFSSENNNLKQNKALCLLSHLPNNWLDILTTSHICGNGENITPIVYNNDRLYIYRNWKMEQLVASKIKALSKPIETTPEKLERIKNILDKLFARDYVFFTKQFNTINITNKEKQIEFILDFFNVQDYKEGALPIEKILKVCNLGSKEDLKAQLDKLIPPHNCIDWQKVAAATALTRNFSVISGGPGTGKTTTVSKLLAAICELANKDGIIIKLAAPTGKAAARLSESISSSLASLNLAETTKKLIPTEASTVHRLLGAIYNKADFRYNNKNKLHLDVLVVDEASMVDLALTSKLLDALPENAVVILLGDKDQLSSVEAGSVLGDICQFALGGFTKQQQQQINFITGFKTPFDINATNFSDSISILRKSYRFHENSGIGRLASAINVGSKSLIDQVELDGFSDINLINLDSDSYADFLKKITNEYKSYLLMIKTGENKKNILDEFSKVRLLCSIRETNCGINQLNIKIETLLESLGLITRPQNSAWYIGRPIMITKNDHALGLFNGDIGICMRGDDEKLYVYFESTGQGVRQFLPSRLPESETIFAMTIHKSQGSEFKKTFIILPNKLSPNLTRELVYTGITRAKSSLEICCLRNVLYYAANHKTTRNSGLISLLK